MINLLFVIGLTEIVVPESLYMYIQEALVLWEQLQANTSDKDLQSKYSDVLRMMDISATLHKYDNDLPSDWTLYVPSLFIHILTLLKQTLKGWLFV